MSSPLALIVDDEPDIRELLEITLARMQVDTVAAENLTEAKARLGDHHFDLCLTDMRLPDGNGIELVEFMQQRHGSVPVAVITAHGSMESAVTALKAGAFDFVSKPVDLQGLRKLVATALRLSAGRSKPERVLIGDSPAIRETRATISKLARSQAPVYISGESGTGKELVARLIHEQGPRSDGPFVPVNCGAIPEDLMESELFGHLKGSFTGALADKQGLFQAADGGTLFLDEVADLPLQMQVKLLRAVQERSVRPIGAQTEVAVDVRVLSATHKPLAGLVKEGRFRQDLYYRINVIELAVPALRERAQDIPQLAEYILVKLAGRAGVAIPTLAPEALAALKGYAFPGNVRELENLLERAMTLSEGHAIGVDDLGIAGPVSAGSPETAGDRDLGSLLDQVEKETILKALEQAGGNKTAAARILGIRFGALRYRLQKLGME